MVLFLQTKIKKQYYGGNTENVRLEKKRTDNIIKSDNGKKSDEEDIILKTGLKLGMQPFWFWNGDMRKEEIVRQIQEMKAKGIPGFMIHPRQGMEVPYMSREFFDRVKTAVQAAKENDMEVWLYDEYPYPSGICGGEVILEHPEFCNKHLEKKVETAEGGKEVKLSAPWGKVLLARAYRIQNGKYNLDDYIDLQDYVGTGYQQEIFQYSGLTEYNKKRYFTGDQVKFLDWQAPEGTWKIYFVTEIVTKHFKYFENFIDTLNPDAIRYFIKLTHERYKKEIGEEFGKTVKGIFTDEITAFPDTQPWSSLLPGEVKKRCGIDLISMLPALWEDFGEISAKVRYAYWNTATDCFIEAYDKQVHEWCRQNNLFYIGEKPILRSKQLQHFDISGIDAGHQKVGSTAKMFIGKYRANGKMVASAAHFYDKPAALCEVGHSIGWGMTMQDMKWMFDYLGVLGIDFFVIHGFFYTADGLKKHDAPPSAFYQMPWWEDASVLTKYAVDLGRFLQSTKRRVRILTIDPVTSAWTSDREIQTRLKDDFADLQTQLMYHGLDYYIIDPELFAQGEVICKDGKTEFLIHGETYEVLILPPVRNLEKEACAKLLEFAHKGGKVCSLHTIPFEEIQDGCNVGEFETIFQSDSHALWEAYCSGRTSASREVGNCYFAGTIKDAIEWLSVRVEQKWKIEALDGLGREELPVMCGTDEDGQEKLFVVNTSRKARRLAITDPFGRVQQIALTEYESRILDYREPAKEETMIWAELDPNREMPYTLTNLNGIRLGFWELSLPDGQKAVVETAPLIDQLETGKLSYPVTLKNYFGCPKELDFKGMQVSYRIKFYCSDGVEKKDPVYLVFEPGTFLGEWKLKINGNLIQEKEFVRKKIYLETNLTAEVGKYLAPGENEIVVEMQIKESFGGMRNPLYLFGEFGVEKQEENWYLVPLKSCGKMEDFCSLGLPFYYGEAVFTGELSVQKNSEEFVFVRMNAEWLTDSVRLKTGDYETAPCAWKPYVFQIPAKYLVKGSNTVKIKVRNTALGLYEGQRFNREKHAYEEV